MKPSERIEEIARKRLDKIASQYFKFVPEGAVEEETLEAIIDYLDEEYEKNRPCEHEDIVVDPFLKSRVCKKCKCLIG